jgi:ABC-2 type transport system ATP-binding protein
VIHPAVEARGLTKHYSTVRAVDGIDFSIRRGSILALLGPNGAGKTTTVRMLVGILPPDAGGFTFCFDETPTSCLSAPDLGYLPEERGLIRDVPLLRTLEHFGVLRGLPRSEARRRAMSELERFDLADRAGERIDRLSKGNQQKVQFLAATLHRPRLAVLDEPFSGFDPVNQERFVGEIRRLRDEGCTVLLSAHQMDLVEQLADEMILVDGGKIVLSGTLDEIRRATSSGQKVEVRVEDADEAQLAALPGVERVTGLGVDRFELALRADATVGAVLGCVTAEFTVLDVHSAPERLHEIFLRTVGREHLDREEQTS